MTTDFERKFSALQDLQTKSDLAQAMNEFSTSRGFCYSSITYVAEKTSLKIPNGSPDRIGDQGWGYATQTSNNDLFFGLTITDEQYLHYFVDPNPPDPVLQTLRWTSLPLAWSASHYENAAELYELMSHFDIRHGVATAIHLPNSEHLIVGFDGPDPLPKTARLRTQILLELQAFATMAIEPGRRLLLEPQYEARRMQFHLTPREIEVLKWSSEGKTADEIGQILGISANTATKHAANTIEKLGCINIKAALVKAIRSGIIS